MKMERLVLMVLALTASVWLAGCDALNPQRPTPQPDTDIYGSLVSKAQDPERPEATVLKIKVGLPRALSGKRAEEGRPEVPVESEDLVATVTVTPDTTAILGDLPAGTLDGFRTGMDVVVLPVPGTTRIVGTKELLADAALIADFESFRSWRLPKSLGETVPEEPSDPARIASAGVEHAPVPLKGGTVLYFAARLRRPWKDGTPWLGAARPGLKPGDGEHPATERSYRTELGSDGWSVPELVTFPGLDDARTVRVTWMDEEERLCLVTVQDGDGTRWVGRSSRAKATAPWGSVERLEDAGDAPAEDAVYLAGSTTAFAFTTDRHGNLDIYLYYPKQGKDPMPLDPRIDTAGNEWAPRTGPANELLFCRGDRQLLYVKGITQPLRVDVPLRIPVTEANPARDGKWMFACLPRYTAGELDRDIVVMPWLEPGKLGEPVPVDDWRPVGETEKE